MNKENKNNNFSYITFVTGNKAKAQEIQALLPGIKIFDIDLPELQELDSRKIITAKARAALERIQGPIIVEDTGLYLDCLEGQLPGPLVKWFLKTMKNIGLVAIANRLGNYGARATSIIGYAQDAQHIQFFEGSIRGTLTLPQGNSVTSFGWDAIFIPAGRTDTFANMELAEKNSMSMRSQAVHKLKAYLQTNSLMPATTKNTIPTQSQ